MEMFRRDMHSCSLTELKLHCFARKWQHGKITANHSLYQQCQSNLVNLVHNNGKKEPGIQSSQMIQYIPPKYSLLTSPYIFMYQLCKHTIIIHNMHELAKYVPQLPLHRRICFTEDVFPQLTLHIYNIVHEVHKYEIRFFLHSNSVLQYLIFNFILTVSLKSKPLLSHNQRLYLTRAVFVVQHQLLCPYKNHLLHRGKKEQSYKYDNWSFN